MTSRIANPADREERPLEQELREVVAVRCRHLVGHPSPEEWVDYYLGVLSSTEVETLQDHLVLCRECSQLMLDLATLSRPSAVEARPPSTDRDREWDRLEERLEREAISTRGRHFSERSLQFALAASVLAALGLAGWNLEIRKDISLERRPRADLALADLTPEGLGAARAVETPMRVRLRLDQGKVLLLLNLGDLREFPSYRVELLSGTTIAWAQSRVRRSEDGTFLLEMPARMLESKIYRVRLYGEGDRETVPLAGYSFEIVRGERPARSR